MMTCHCISKDKVCFATGKRCKHKGYDGATCLIGATFLHKVANIIEANVKAEAMDHREP